MSISSTLALVDAMQEAGKQARSDLKSDWSPFAALIAFLLQFVFISVLWIANHNLCHGLKHFGVLSYVLTHTGLAFVCLLPYASTAVSKTLLYAHPSDQVAAWVFFLVVATCASACQFGATAFGLLLGDNQKSSVTRREAKFTVLRAAVAPCSSLTSMVMIIATKSAAWSAFAFVGAVFGYGTVAAWAARVRQSQIRTGSVPMVQQGSN
eukprot:CAMPEP_0114545608 /NCGR_PEP_ID=MMETSP0114-20121206/3499_1 /TAXON_ID=31324 /ORGANISM="Goniomonas sp, Strain m" /LENGTH=208 /DNA_ID=CAMNT_0001730063 /DNA_START=481 /DNA_END=1107 /DNA_ORIENTATION=+